ncbi:hypothetical protein AMTR_s00048p00180940 [Amborella trichopoda]|uniref:Uncharacterized protein n=1 Tax=Amborella trichopoda TaxID=13333 RepID=U5D065_AMBTC|nr:hypothetical protein AMTR_s00048p00180940 [Amborella trichopoda]
MGSIAPHGSHHLSTKAYFLELDGIGSQKPIQTKRWMTPHSSLDGLLNWNSCTVQRRQEWSLIEANAYSQPVPDGKGTYVSHVFSTSSRWTRNICFEIRLMPRDMGWHMTKAIITIVIQKGLLNQNNRDIS